MRELKRAFSRLNVHGLDAVLDRGVLEAEDLSCLLSRVDDGLGRVVRLGRRTRLTLGDVGKGRVDLEQRLGQICKEKRSIRFGKKD